MNRSIKKLNDALMDLERAKEDSITQFEKITEDIVSRELEKKFPSWKFEYGTGHSQRGEEQKKRYLILVTRKG